MINKTSIIVLLIITQFSCESHNKVVSKEATSTSKTGTNNQQISTPIIIHSEKADTLFIHENFEYEGKIQDAINWHDEEGGHIVFTCETGVYYTDIVQELYGEEFKQNAKIHAYHYLKTKNGFELKWKIYDFATKCPVDASAFFVKNSLEVTDLNANGIAEISLIYMKACRGDASPSDMKLIIYEGSEKSKLEGNSKVNEGYNEFYGGEIEKIVHFENKQVLLDFAKKKWKANTVETF